MTQAAKNLNPSLVDKLAGLPPEIASSFAQLFGDNIAHIGSVEGEIRKALASFAPQLTEISSYLLGLGGKRVRPLLAIVTGRLFGMEIPSKELITAAAGIELIHMATLLHDDIIDESPTRRNQTSAYKAFGMAPTLLTGDFLLARAFGLCAHLDLFVIEATERACVELTEGELLEGHIALDSPTSIEHYLDVVRRKTASLFGLAAAVGAHIAKADDQDVELLRNFGYCAGISFQIVDDILDVTADEDLLGKPSGTDLRQRTPSIVNILWLQQSPDIARRFFSQKEISESEAKSAAHSLKSSSVIDQARDLAVEFSNQAKASLDKLRSPNVSPEIKHQLCALVDYTLSRAK